MAHLVLALVPSSAQLAPRWAQAASAARRVPWGDRGFIMSHYWPVVDRALEAQLPELVRARTVEGRPHCFPVALNRGTPGTLVPC